MIDASDEFQRAIAKVANDMLAEVETLGMDGLVSGLSLEQVFVDPSLMAIPASPLQLAIIRASCGLPLNGVLTQVEQKAFLGHTRTEPDEAPKRVVLICGVRGGKSTLGIGRAITGSLTVDLSTIQRHEIPRYPIVGPTVDAAKATYRQLIGYLQSSKTLSRFIDGEPTAESVTIRRPDGRRVEIIVVAAHRGGLSVRNRWLCGITLEEVASFGSESTGAVVNAEEILRAAETRLLPGCQSWLISSPFGPVGLLYDLYRKHFGNPGNTLVVHAPTRALNPSFPQSQIDGVAKDDPDTAAREYGAEWVDADSSFLSAAWLDAATRAAPLVKLGRATVAAIDPATRGNAWTLAVGWSEPHYDGEDPKSTARKVTVAGVWQWVGSKKTPLRPREVFVEIADILKPFGVREIVSDSWSLDALIDHASAVGLSLTQHEGDGMLPYASLKTLFGNGLIELPPDQAMRKDLLAIRQRATANGVNLHLPKTADGRHCDFAPSVALVAHYAEAAREITYEYTPAKDTRHGGGGGEGGGRGGSFSFL